MWVILVNEATPYSLSGDAAKAHHDRILEGH